MKKTNSPSEGTVCRAVLDRNAVLAQQIFQVLVEEKNETLSNEKLSELRSKINSLVTTNTDGLVGYISNLYSK